MEQNSTLLGDLVCDGEGIEFMRDLLGERQGEPVVHPAIVYDNRLLSLPLKAGRKLVVCTGLGCPEGCDFCAPSHRFGRQYHPFVEEGEQVFAILNDLHEQTGIDEFQLFDENFLLHEKRARGLADAFERHGRSFEFFTFSSVNALSRYSAEELIRTGVSAVWLGLEGKRGGYSKLQGEQTKELVSRLTDHGILVCGSMIIGFDYQTPEIIEEELESHLDTNLTYMQCLIYGPTPGTPLYRRLDQESRWRGRGFGDQVSYDRSDGFELTFEHPTISADEMSRLQQMCYERATERLGHSAFRAIDTWHRGYEKLQGTSNGSYLARRAAVYERKLSEARAFLPLGIRHAPTSETRGRLGALEEKLRAHFGPYTLKERALTRAVFPLAEKWTRYCIDRDLFQQPGLIRRAYRC